MLFPGRHRQRHRRNIPVLAIVGTGLLTACAHAGPANVPNASNVPDAHAGTAAPSGASSGAVAPATGCTPDYCALASWETAPAPTPLTQIPPFSEPLNVVISARSNVTLSAIQQALATWKTVHANTTVSVAGIHLMCISSEKADVTAGGYVAQQVAWRLDGCAHGNELSLSGREGHVRMWHQPVPGSANGAWFAAASYETMCLVRNGTLQTVAANERWAALHPSTAYHCVNGGPGTITTSYPNGYDDGARAFAAAVTQAAQARGWHLSERLVTVPRRAHAGEGRVPFSPGAYVLTVTSLPGARSSLLDATSPARLPVLGLTKAHGKQRRRKSVGIFWPMSSTLCRR